MPAQPVHEGVDSRELLVEREPNKRAQVGNPFQGLGPNSAAPSHSFPRRFGQADPAPASDYPGHCSKDVNGLSMHSQPRDWDIDAMGHPLADVLKPINALKHSAHMTQQSALSQSHATRYQGLENSRGSVAPGPVPQSKPEFLRFSTRHNSEISYTSSSGRTSFGPASEVKLFAGGVADPIHQDWQDKDVPIEKRGPETLPMRMRTLTPRDLNRGSNGSDHRSSRPTARGLAHSGSRSTTSHPESTPRPKLEKTEQTHTDSHAPFPRTCTSESRSDLDMRQASFTASKWLSFDRVLVSPAHTELSKISGSAIRDHRVLVLDGLGIDWSYSCAQTYPNADVYALLPERPLATRSETETTFWPPLLPNHHVVPLQSETGLFLTPKTTLPFPRSFFKTIVIRFPPAAPESYHRALLAESKRVLCPDGWLEINVLDIDPVCIGTLMRKACRELKTRMSFQRLDDERYCLGNASDVFMKQLGRCRWENVLRCFVGVPVARRSTQGASGFDLSNPVRPSSPLRPEFGARCDSEEPTSTISYVGRWWYKQCYETTHNSRDSNPTSLFDDESLLRECEQMGTNFRLLIACAQKPHQTPRRTISL